MGHKQHQEIQHQENTYHDGNIVIGQDAQRKADAVQPVFPFSHQLFKPQGYQGEQENTIQPHHVPVIGRQIAGHGIKNGKGNHGRASGFKMPGKIPGKGKTAEADFQDDQIGHELDQVFIREKGHKPVEGTCHIIGVKRKKIRAHAHIPGIGKAVPASDFAEHFRKKGDVLVVHVRVHEAFIAKRENAVDNENRQHDQKRNGKGKQAGPVASYPSARGRRF